MTMAAESHKTGKSNPQRKGRYYSRRLLDPSLVAYYYRHFGHVRRILDLGCGLGCMGRLKPEAAIEVYGLDIDEVAVAEARQYENAQVWNLETPRLPFDEDYFDAVLAKDILEHLQAPWVLVAEIYRILRPGGVVMASAVMAKPGIVWDDYTHIRGFTRRALGMLFEDVGFDVLHIHKMGGVPLAGKLHLIKWLPWLLRFPPFDFLFGTSLEIKARRPVGEARD
jgi:SAM-dependent methyltransferase